MLSVEGGEVDKSGPELDSNGRATITVTSGGSVEYRWAFTDTQYPGIFLSVEQPCHNAEMVHGHCVEN